ncbi:D123 protein [Bradyrhizobium huanghuaihaiense]|uniref:D123 protein n=1 Tax=Bradyrhizobium huanghuaihaiense TaxID=990078 RepID=A0A562RUD0_9BRAD|nr:D123 protein [Bradyrhizobium huanghuaihaiense]
MVTFSDATASREGAERFINVASPTFLENWPLGLRKLSVRQTDVRLSRMQCAGILRYLKLRDIGAVDNVATNPFAINRLDDAIESIRPRLNTALRSYYRGAYLRFGSRSPKDSAHGLRYGFRVRSAQQSLAIILTSRERVRFDLAVAHLAGYQSHLFLREWINVPQWKEFRCFMLGRQLRGISQYHYTEGVTYPGIVANANDIRRSLSSFFTKFRDASHLDDVIFDVAFNESSDPILIEINPSSKSGLSDLCLFHGMQLDGRFRFLGDGHDYKRVCRARSARVSPSSLSGAE